MIAYPEETIIFYAIVENNNSAICLLPEQTTKILEKHHLRQTSVESRGLYSNFKDLKNCLTDLLFEVGNSPIAKQEEGAVIYLIK